MTAGCDVLHSDLVWVILVQVTKITRDIGSSLDILVQEADHTSVLEIVCPGHLAACIYVALYGLYCACPVRETNNNYDRT